MADKLMCIPNDDIQNHSFCKLNVKDWNVWTLTEPTNQMSINISKVVKPTN